MLRRRAGFTLIELLVVISIIALLIALLMPALGTARRATRDMMCVANLHQITTAMNAYAVDSKTGWYIPSASVYDDSLRYLFTEEHLTDPQIAICPNTVNTIGESSSVTVFQGGRFVTKVRRHPGLSKNARNAHDSIPGHSYEVWSVAGMGTHVDGNTFENEFNPDANAYMDGERVHLDHAKIKPSSFYIILDSDEDGNSATTNNNWPDAETNNHGDRGVSLGFLDGHAEFANKERYVEASLFSYHPYFGNNATCLSLAQSEIPNVNNSGGWYGRWWFGDAR